MSQNAMFLYEDASPVATLSWGNWQISRDNLLDENLSKVARTDGVALADTRFRVALDATYYSRAIVVGPGTFSPLYSYRIRTFSDAAFSTIETDTGWIQPAAAQGSAVIHWGEPGFWLRDVDRGVCLIHVFDDVVPAQYWSVEIDDEDNPDGFLDLGCLFMPLGWQPSLNFTPQGNGLSFGNNSGVQQTLSGRKIFRRRTNPRRWRFAFDFLPKDEAFTQAYHFFQRVGFDGRVFVIPDPDGAEHITKRSFFGTVVQQGGISQALPRRYDTSGEIEELI